MVFTRFWDMHSGGGLKESPYNLIFIEAPEQEAISVFYSKFGHNPERVSCTCCGPDYSINEDPDLEEATSYHRIVGDKFTNKPKYMPLDQFLEQENVMVIYEDEITDDDRTSDVPRQGYIWM